MALRTRVMRPASGGFSMGGNRRNAKEHSMDRSAVTLELQPLLVELIDVGMTAKQAHWNVTGPLFRPLHAQLDDLADDARTWADMVAERVVALGEPSDGRIETVAAQTPLPGFPDGFVEDSKV